MIGSKHLSDEQFVTAFEKCELSETEFNHASHIRVTWIYLRNYTLPETLVRICEGIKKFAASKNKENLFNDTITIFYSLIIHQRLNASKNDSWEIFCGKNADLFNFKEFIEQYYDFQTLKSDLARETFIFPTCHKGLGT